VTTPPTTPPTTQPTTPPTSQPAGTVRDPRHDFDFLHGTWRIDHRRLKERLTGCQEWEEFSTDLRCYPILGGAGNIDEGAFPSRGYHAMSLRLYDEHEQAWSIFWVTSLSAAIDPPVIGRFGADGTGEFLGPDTHNGIPVLVRYLWSAITPASVRWEQALSTDEGKTWEINWVMNLTRT
jgi:hypothetical protein